MHRILWIWVGLLLLCNGCIDPYELPVTGGDTRILVINGYLDVEQRACNIRLSYTQDLANRDKPIPALHATITLESERNEAFPLSAKEDGHYQVTDVPVILGSRYRLRVKAQDGAEYVSDYVTARTTPAIDSLSWRVQQEGIAIEVSTHDDNNATRYYLWDIAETWQYRANENSRYELLPDGQLVNRAQSIYICWKTEKPSAIFIGTSERLSKDVISNQQLLFRPGRTPYFSYGYSILVGQYAISKEEYSYREMLRNNSENVGTLFDAQPSLVTGNYTCINKANTPVLGYFSTRHRQEKRMFISADDVRPWGFTWNPPGCALDTLNIKNTGFTEFNSGVHDLVLFIDDGIYTYAKKSCTDCRLQGGINIKPAFWP